MFSKSGSPLNPINRGQAQPAWSASGSIHSQRGQKGSFILSKSQSGLLASTVIAGGAALLCSLPTAKAATGELDGVGDVHTCDALSEAVDESLSKSDGFDPDDHRDRADSEHVSNSQRVPHTWSGRLVTGVLYRRDQRKQG